jgi:DNA invertase Pin-like site-specific DNA recombinase
MELHTIRQLLKTKSIYDIPLRVTFYARVSSESDEQLNSLSNQIAYYEDKIKKVSCWTFVPGYIDEGISGISTKKREDFNRMISDAEQDMFDLIITKEISRFARNTVDSISFTRQLQRCGVGVFFENDGINTLDEDAELRLAIMSSIAQEELRKLSARVQFGHKQAIKDGVVLGNSRIFGYTKNNGKLVIDEKQAEMVRELFELYATDEYSMKQIEVIFWDKGYRNLNGKKIAHSTMSNMIANAKYKGYYVGNKVKVVDMFTKKQKFLPPEEWVMFKDETGEIVPAIVSEELWDKANEILRRRSDDVKNRQGICNHANLLTGKLFCSSCGTPYYRRDSKDKQGNKNSKWVCSGKINNGKDSCDSFAIYESEIIPLLFEVFKDTSGAAMAMIEEYEEMYRSISSDENLNAQIEKQKSLLARIAKKKEALLDLRVDGAISNEEFKQRNTTLDAEKKEAEENLEELELQRVSSEAHREHMAQIHAALKAAERDVANGKVTKEFIDTFIDKILVTPQEDGKMELDIRIFTGESTKKYLARLKSRASTESRTGQMSKKMIEAYEQSMQ